MKLRAELSDPGRVIAKLTKARERVWKAWGQTLTEAGAEMREIIINRYRSKKGRKSTQRITSNLALSYKYRVQARKDHLDLAVGVLQPVDGQVLQYAHVHEGFTRTGREVSSTTIRPRRSKYLAIPLDGARRQSRTGTRRAPRPRDFANTFLLTGGMSPIIAQKGAGDFIIPLFVLKKSVTVPARPALRPVFRWKQPRLQADLGKAYADVLR